MYRLGVYIRSSTLSGIETLIANNLVDYAHNNLATAAECDTNGVWGKAVNKIGGVEWINNPYMLASGWQQRRLNRPW